MKIKLSQSELEKCYNLFDVKEINISVADLLFSTFEETEFFNGCDDNDEFFSQLIRFWGIPSDSKEEINILEKWVKPAISPLNSDYFSKNPYYSTVLPKPFKNDKYSLDYISFASYQPLPLDEITVKENDNFMEISPLSYFKEEQKYLALSKDGCVWMSITPNEINTMAPHIEKAKDDVLVFGLGLGYYPFMISLKEEVKHITIVEMDDTIIDIFKKHILPFFKHKDKIEIVKDDAKRYIKNLDKKYDTIFIDLWHNPVDGLPLFIYFKQFENRYRQSKFQYWLEESLIALYRRCILTVFEESLNHFRDEDYLKAKNEMDKIVNAIYFKTKNITINNYDDIHKLLTKKSILELLIK